MLNEISFVCFKIAIKLIMCQEKYTSPVIFGLEILGFPINLNRLVAFEGNQVTGNFKIDKGDGIMLFIHIDPYLKGILTEVIN